MSRNRKKGKAKQAIGLLFMLLSLTSCGRLKSNYAIEAGIREILPDAVILNVETGTRAKGRKFKRLRLITRVSYLGIVLKKMDGQWSPPKAAIYDKTDHNPVHAMAF